MAEKAVDAINNINKNKTAGKSHADYINRAEQFQTRGGCIYTAHHLPEWAEDSPRNFFAAVEKYGRDNECQYKEIEMALPNELDTEECKKIIEEFIDHHLKNFYYAYAIHDKLGVMAEGKHNKHVHIMFSEREIDEYERTHGRTAKQFFSRGNSKADEERGRIGGCKKAAKWNGSKRNEYLKIIREDYAKILTGAMAANGYAVKYEWRTLKEQKEEAEKNGDMVAAALLDRVPEKHLGPRISSNPEHPEVKDLMEYRRQKAERQRMLCLHDLAENHNENLKVELQNMVAESAKRNPYPKNPFSFQIINSDDPELVNLRRGMLQNLDLYREECDKILWNNDAIDFAKMNQMAQSERELYAELRFLRTQLNKIKKDKEMVEKYPNLKIEEKPIKSKEQILEDITEEERHVKAAILEYTLQLKPTFERLQIPYCKRAMQEDIISVIQDDKKKRGKLAKLQRNLEDSLIELREKIAEKAEEEAKKAMGLNGDSPTPDYYALKDIEKILDTAIKGMESILKQQEKEKNLLERRLISPARAWTIACDVYTKQGFKKLREEKALLKKEQERIGAAKKEYYEAEKNGTQENELGTMFEAINQRTKELNAKIDDWNERYKKLLNYCEKPGPKAKIKQIAEGILNKNKDVKDSYDICKKNIEKITQRKGELTELIVAVRIRKAKDKYSIAGKITEKKYKPTGLGQTNIVGKSDGIVSQVMKIAEEIRDEIGKNESLDNVRVFHDEEDERQRRGSMTRTDLLVETDLDG